MEVAATKTGTVDPAPHEEEAGDGADQTVLHCRFGSFVLTSDTPFARPYKKTLDDVIASLDQDPRVVDSEPPNPFEEDWCQSGTIYPSPSSGFELVSGADRLYSLRFNRPLRISVEVPEKNQRRIVEGDALPTRYEALWHGELALVTWRANGMGRAPMSGGHVVADVLSDALKGLGLRLYVQGCHPGCSYQFAHTTLRVRPDPSNQSVRYRPEHWYSHVAANVGPAPDDVLAQYLFTDIRTTAEDFTEMKNLGRRILESETDGRDSLDSLMKINYQRAEIPTLGPIDRQIARWHLRGWRKKSRRLIARVWLTLSNLEALQRRWQNTLFQFEEQLDERGLRPLFELDYADEVAGVKSLDPGLLRSGVQEAAKQLDSRVLVTVTAIAGVAGGLAGALVGAISKLF